MCAPAVVHVKVNIDCVDCIEVRPPARHTEVRSDAPLFDYLLFYVPCIKYDPLCPIL